MKKDHADGLDEVLDNEEITKGLLNGETDNLRHSETSKKGASAINDSRSQRRIEQFGVEQNKSSFLVETGEKVKDMSYWESCKIVVKLAVPPIVSSFFYMFVQLVNTYFVGHLNDAVLMAGVGMGNMLINVLCFAIAQGMNGALETYCSQAFGQGKFRMVGVFHMRGRFVVTLLMIPLIIIFALSDQILIAIKQEPSISYIAKLYVCILIPGCWAMSQFDACRKFLIAQHKQNLPVYVQIVTTVLHFVWCYLFITYWDLRVVGAALSLNITYILNWIITDAYIHFSGCCPQTWILPSKETTQNIGEYAKIGFAGAMMLCFEWWAFELLAIFSGYLGVAALAAEVVIINIISFIFMLPLGISYSASCLVGNYIGEKNIKLAKRFANLTVLFNVICTVVVIIIFATLKTGISNLFTTEREVVAVIDQVFWILVVYIFFDTIHGVQSGIIRGLGRQGYGSIYTLICYYIFGMPLALVFAFVLEWGVAGLWAGFTIACIVLDIGFFFIIACANWEKIAEVSAAKIEAQEKARLIEIEKNTQLQGAEKEEVLNTPNAQRRRVVDAIDAVNRSRNAARI